MEHVTTVCAVVLGENIAMEYVAPLVMCAITGFAVSLVSIVTGSVVMIPGYATRVSAVLLVEYTAMVHVAIAGSIVMLERVILLA